MSSRPQYDIFPPVAATVSWSRSTRSSPTDIVLSKALSYVACSHPDNRVVGQIVVNLAVKDFDPDSAFSCPEPARTDFYR